MRKLLCKLIILLLAAGCIQLYRTEQALSALEEGIIRLHITADSDSLADQTQKLMIRDAVLAHAADWDTANDCLTALERALPEIERISTETLRQAGSAAAVSAEITEEDFPARQYGAVTLPAGRYRALRITVGSGAGQNWWCVMYPAMCIPAASEAAAEDTLSEAVRDMALHPEQYEIRLKCVDTARAVFNWLQNPSEQAEAAPSDEETVPQADFLNRISSRSHCCIRSRYCRSCCRSSSRTAESE